MADALVDDLQTQFPSIDLAYELATQSYDSIRPRWEAINGLFHSLLSLAMTLTLATPVLAKALDLSLETHWVIAVLTMFLLTSALCLWGRLTGSLRMLSPDDLYNKHLAHTESEFKKTVIYWAGQDFNLNAARIHKKWRISVCATGFLCLEAALVVLWIAYPNP